jgi:1,4-dihydroxy-2-naphthoyl-CoA hydrolase
MTLAAAKSLPPMTGWAKAMGIVVLRSTVDEVSVELEVGEIHCQSFGLVHGGVYCGLVETACSLGASLVAHARRQTVVGLENSTSFLKATRSGALRATAVPLTRGRTTQVWQTTVVGGDGQIVAVGRVRFLCAEHSVS